MLPVIQSLWIGDDLTQLEKLCVKSFMDHGHEFHLYTYGDIGGIPEGAIVKDGNKILPESEIFETKRGGVAAFSDWFRYALLAKYGDFWVDMDTVCIKPFDFEEEILFPTMDFRGVNNPIIKCPKGHELMIAMEKSCRYNNEEMPWDDSADKERKQKRRKAGAEKAASGTFEFGGGPVFMKAIKYFEMEKHCVPFMVFDPIGGDYKEHMFDETFRDGVALYEKTHAIHIANSLFSSMEGFDKNANFDKRSLFEQLKAKHGIASVPDAVTIGSAEIRTMAGSRKQKKISERSTTRRKNKIIAAVVIAIAFGLGLLV